jgi:hypothetical protein
VGSDLLLVVDLEDSLEKGELFFLWGHDLKVALNK